MNEKQSKALLLKQLYEPHKKCSPCPLALQTNHNFVCGHGSPNAKLMLIGEAPVQHEDEQGLPFVGKSGMLLTKTLACLGIDRKEIFITNIVKCRPTNNRKPTPAESKTYKHLFLLKEIEIIKPTVICTLGATALEGLLEAPVKMEKCMASNWLSAILYLFPPITQHIFCEIRANSMNGLLICKKHGHSRTIKATHVCHSCS